MGAPALKVLIVFSLSMFSDTVFTVLTGMLAVPYFLEFRGL
jgi:hypothetical protein